MKNLLSPLIEANAINFNEYLHLIMKS